MLKARCESHVTVKTDKNREINNVFDDRDLVGTRKQRNSAAEI